MSAMEKRGLSGRDTVASGLKRLIGDNWPVSGPPGDREKTVSVEHHVRPIERRDFRWARSLHSTSYKSLVISQFGYWDSDEQTRYFNEKWDDGSLQVIMVRNVRVGVICLEHRAESLWIGDIQITPRWRGRGFASMIIKDLLAEARILNVPVETHVLQMNIRAKKFYDRLGFSFSHEDADYVYMRLV